VTLITYSVTKFWRQYYPADQLYAARHDAVLACATPDGMIGHRHEGNFVARAEHSNAYMVVCISAAAKPGKKNPGLWVVLL